MNLNLVSLWDNDLRLLLLKIVCKYSLQIKVHLSIILLIKFIFGKLLILYVKFLILQNYCNLKNKNLYLFNII